MLSENSVDWKPCWWKNNGDDNSLRVKTVEMLNMLRVKSNRLVDRKPMWCKTVEILWQCWLNPTPPNSTSFSNFSPLYCHHFNTFLCVHSCHHMTLEVGKIQFYCRIYRSYGCHRLLAPDRTLPLMLMLGMK